jgi:hypothetical protein
MRSAFRILAVTAVAALCGLGLLPAAHAAGPVFTVWDGSSYEYYKSCTTSPPYSCGANSLSMYLQISVANRTGPITLGYQITDITATAGQDYTFPTSGTVTIPSGQYVTGLHIPLVNDGVTEPNETFRVRLTSSSAGGDISDTGIGTIWDAGQIPLDCNLNRTDSMTVSMTCTNRPPTQRWFHNIQCGKGWTSESVNGPTITGNGTSTARCAQFVYKASSFHIVQ